MSKLLRSSVQFVTFFTSLLTSGRIDRKIEFPLPDEKTKKRIFQIHTSRMTVADDVTLDDLILAKDDLSGADIKVKAKLVTLKSQMISSLVPLARFHYLAATLFL